MNKLTYTLGFGLLVAEILNIGVANNVLANNTGEQSRQYNLYIEAVENQRANRPGQLKTRYDEVVKREQKETRAGDEVYVYENNRYRSSRSITDLILYDRSAATIYPGSLLLAEPLLRHSRLEPLPIDSPAPVRLTVTAGLNESQLSSFEHSGSYSDFVKNAAPVVASIRHGDARISFMSKTGKSLETALLKANMSASGWGISASGSYSKDVTKESSFGVIAVDQIYFTIVSEPESGGSFIPRSLFANKQQSELLHRSLARNGEAAVVQSVSYGRRLVITVESSSSEEELSAALQASYSGFGANASGDVETKTKRLLQRSEINAYAIGGSVNQSLLDIFSSDRTALAANVHRFLSSTAEITPDIQAAPLSFTAVYAIDRAEASANLTEEFSGIVPKGSYRIDNDKVFSKDIEISPKHAKVVSGDSEIDTDDWTWVRISYQLDGVNRRVPKLNVIFEAREGNHKKQFSDTHFMSRKNFNLGQYDRALKKFYTRTSDSKVHWYKGKRHGLQDFPDFGPFRDIQVSFDRKGRSDHKVMKMIGNVTIEYTLKKR